MENQILRSTTTRTSFTNPSEVDAYHLRLKLNKQMMLNNATKREESSNWNMTICPTIYLKLVAAFDEGEHISICRCCYCFAVKWFSPEALHWLFMKGLVGWFLQFLLLKMSLLPLGSGEAPFLDIITYAGYTFIGMCLAVLGRIIGVTQLSDCMDMFMHGNFLGEDN
ncbi:uncharacterized protein LOC130783382 [Actinidia eriantha]|uniref:uncharacterized protein LOC130783382 n=1 Tax=Actinidia eriantha TaxID=165200 RepID=UPI002584C9B3|nr:uncharacterized protein LOC130783382 [Actinidia eriantha]